MERSFLTATILTLIMAISSGVVTGQHRQKTFRAMKIANSPVCILDTPSQSLLVGKLQCSLECTVKAGCDYFNVIDQSGVTNGVTKTCQLFLKTPSFFGVLSGCTAFENTAPNCQFVAAVGSSATTLSPPYCCNVLFTGQLETQCLTTVSAGNGCSTVTSDKNVTCSPATRASLPSTTSVSIVPALSIGSRILLQNKVAYGTATMSFNALWAAYANGIGQPSMTDNYWIGNEKMYALTSGSAKYRLRVEIQRVGGSWLYAEYDSFIVGSSSTSYQLNVYGTYSGNAGDAIRVPTVGWNANGKIFGTRDRDSKSCSPGTFNCATDLSGTGWWFACCSVSDVNADVNSCWTVGSPVTWDVVASRIYAQQS